MTILLLPKRQPASLLLAGVFIALISGCSSTPSMIPSSTEKPKNPENLCAIFQEKPDWYASAKDAQKRWGVPPHVPMAMMYQESSFRHDARPPKKYIMGVIPNGHISSAYGYSQALDGTWAEYQRLNGKRFASRDNFGDAIDFMGWYMDRTTRMNRVSKSNAYDQYLNYHEGQGGYRKKSYNKKPWLIHVAKKVDDRAKRYSWQYAKCELEPKRGFWSWLF
jgi:hypothetical protein